MNHNDIPQHIPVQTAIVPDQKPYNRTHVIHTSPQQHRVSQHSLSPEKLGVVGYVKDVAGFVKDMVHEKQQKNKDKTLKEDASHQKEEQSNHEPSTHEVSSHEVSSHEKRDRSPLAEVVTGLFPMDHECTHLEELNQRSLGKNKLL